jgi:hypothetical protein
MIPDESGSSIAASMSRNSLERPVNGHVNRTYIAYERRPGRCRATSD